MCNLAARLTISCFHVEAPFTARSTGEVVVILKQEAVDVVGVLAVANTDQYYETSLGREHIKLAWY